MSDNASLLIPKDLLKDAKLWSPGPLAGRGASGERRAANQSDLPLGRRQGDAVPTTPEEREAMAAAARAAAERTRAANALKAQRQAAFDAGYGEGKALVEAHLARLAALVGNLQAATSTMEADLAEQIVVFAFDIARQVVRAELALNRETMLPLVQEVLRAVPEGTPGGEILLNPEDVELVRSRLDEDLRLGGWRVVAERAVEPGGCRLVSRTCDIDATLASRWKKTMNALARDDAWTVRHDHDEKAKPGATSDGRTA